MLRKKKNKKKKKTTLMITIMILFTFGITIGYSLLSSTISAGGSATAELVITNTKLDNSLILAGGSTYVNLILAHTNMNSPTEQMNVDNDALTQTFTVSKANPAGKDQQTRIIYTNYDAATLTNGSVGVVHTCGASMFSYSADLDITSLATNDSGTVNVYLNYETKNITSCTVTTTLQYDQGTTTRYFYYFINIEP